MRTTTVVFRFAPESSQEVLSTKAADYIARTSPALNEFASQYNTSIDNLVSEDVNHETCLRTVVRSWPTVDVATAWVTASLNATWLTDEYPGVVLSAQVDPE